MRPKEISLNILPIKPHEDDDMDHVSTSHDTPLRVDAFDLTDDQKIEKIEGHFREIMQVLGLDLTDDSLKASTRNGVS